MSRNVKLAILGCGYIGQVHLQSALVMEDVEVVAIADQITKNREKAEEWGVPSTYTDYEKLLDKESPDAVVITLPPFLHVKAATYAAEQECDIFVEKPFARTTDEAKSIQSLGTKFGIKIGVDHTWRYYPQIEEIKERYDNGNIGHVPICWISRMNSGPFESPPATKPLSKWKLDREATGGGVVLSLGVHMFDVLEWFFGDLEVRSVELDRQLEIPFEDAATIQVKSGQTGTVGTMTCGIFQWDDPPDINMQFRLEGVTGSLDIQNHIPENFYLHAGKAMIRNTVKRLSGNSPNYYEPTFYFQAHFKALQQFITAVQADQRPPITGEDGVRSIELVEDVYKMTNEPFSATIDNNE